MSRCTMLWEERLGELMGVRDAEERLGRVAFWKARMGR